METLLISHIILSLINIICMLVNSKRITTYLSFISYTKAVKEEGKGYEGILFFLFMNTCILVFCCLPLLNIYTIYRIIRYYRHGE